MIKFPDFCDMCKKKFDYKKCNLKTSFGISYAICSKCWYPYQIKKYEKMNLKYKNKRNQIIEFLNILLKNNDIYLIDKILGYMLEYSPIYKYFINNNIYWIKDLSINYDYFYDRSSLIMFDTFAPIFGISKYYIYKNYYIKNQNIFKILNKNDKKILKKFLHIISLSLNVSSYASFDMWKTLKINKINNSQLQMYLSSIKTNNSNSYSGRESN